MLGQKGLHAALGEDPSEICSGVVGERSKPGRGSRRSRSRHARSRAAGRVLPLLAEVDWRTPVVVVGPLVLPPTSRSGVPPAAFSAPPLAQAAASGSPSAASNRRP
jgi:hypothetical protein